MSYEIQGNTIIDENRNIVGANTYNGYVPVSPTLTVSSGNGMIGGGQLSGNISFTIRAGNGLNVNTSGIHVVGANGISANNTTVFLDENYISRKYTRFSQFDSNTDTYSTLIGPVGTPTAIAYWHSQAGAPSDVPVRAQGAGFIVSNPWKEHQIHFDALNKIYYKSGNVVSEFWTTANLNPANANTVFTAGNGLVGGGSLGASRTFSVGQGDGITVNPTNVAVDSTVLRTTIPQTIPSAKTFNNQALRVSGESNTSSYIQYLKGSIIRWQVGGSSSDETGGNIGTDYVITRHSDTGEFINTPFRISREDGLVTIPNGGGISNIQSNNIVGVFTDNQLPSNIVRNTIAITAGNGLTGGGNLTTSRSLAVGAGDGIIVNTANVAVDETVLRTTGTQTISGSKIFNTDLLQVNGTDGGYGLLSFNTNGIARWKIGKTNTVDGNNNAGSNFAIWAYDNAGANLPTPFTINRGTLQVTIPNGSGIANIQANNIVGTIPNTNLPTDLVRNTLLIGTATNSGLEGGGNLTAARNLTVKAGNGIIVNANGVNVDSNVFAPRDSYLTFISGGITTYASNSNINHFFRDSSVTSNSQRGALYYNNNNDSMTLVLYDKNTGLATSSVALFSDRFSSLVPFTGNGSGLTNLDATSLIGTIADARIPTNIVRNTISITAGNGLTGGGNLTTSRSLAVGAGAGIIVGTTAVAVNAGNALTANSSGVHVLPGNGLELNENNTAIRINSDVVITNGNPQTINGVKTFTSVVTAPGFNATSATQGFWGIANDSATNPSFSWSGTPQTGIWKTPGGIGFSVGGTNRAQITADGIVGNGSGLVSLNASQLTTGTIPEARLSSVRNVIADFAAGSVGSYALLGTSPMQRLEPGSTIAGSNLRWASYQGPESGAPGGTWRVMGFTGGSKDDNSGTVMLRIA